MYKYTYKKSYRYIIYVKIELFGDCTIICSGQLRPWEKSPSARACDSVWPEHVIGSHLRFGISICCAATAMVFRVFLLDSKMDALYFNVASPPAI